MFGLYLKGNGVSGSVGAFLSLTMQKTKVLVQWWDTTVGNAVWLNFVLGNVSTLREVANRWHAWCRLMLKGFLSSSLFLLLCLINLHFLFHPLIHYLTIPPHPSLSHAFSLTLISQVSSSPQFLPFPLCVRVSLQKKRQPFLPSSGAIINYLLDSV